MLGLLLPLVLALLLGALGAGSSAGLRRIRVRWWPIVLVSIGVELMVYNPPVDRQPWALAWGPDIWVVCLVGMLAVLIRNGLSDSAGRVACRLAALGVAANLLVILANGGYMPQSPAARMASNGVPLVVEGEPPRLRNVTPSGPTTRLAWLGDVIGEPSWLPRANVISPGDLALSLALGWWALRVTTFGQPAGARSVWRGRLNGAGLV